MGNLSGMLNIGKVVEEQLNAVGIDNADQLTRIGAEAAWLKIRQADESACIHRLLALEGAIRGIKKTDIPAGRRAELKRFYYEHKK